MHKTTSWCFHQGVCSMFFNLAVSQDFCNFVMPLCTSCRKNKKPGNMSLRDYHVHFDIAVTHYPYIGLYLETFSFQHLRRSKILFFYIFTCTHIDKYVGDTNQDCNDESFKTLWDLFRSQWYLEEQKGQSNFDFQSNKLGPPPICQKWVANATSSWL